MSNVVSMWDKVANASEARLETNPLSRLMHWMPARMGNPDRTVAITDPNGETWMLGDKCILLSTESRDDVLASRLTYIFEGDGCFDARPIGGDVDAVWFHFENGWAARPWLCRKIRGAK